jgi:large subunit ribosomal protein L54
VIKDQPDPVALPDDQYPAWLWTILDDSSVKLENEKKAGKADSGDIDFLLEKKRLRAKYVHVYLGIKRNADGN